MNKPARQFEVGTPVPRYDTVVTRDRQRRYHEPAEVPDGLFGDVVDVSVLANDCIHATHGFRTGKIDAVHFGQRMQQFEPVCFDEPLSLTGRLSEATNVPKGLVVRYAFDFQRPDGTVPVKGEIVSLRIDAEAMRAGSTGPGKPFDLTGLEALAIKHATPERVKAYSAEFPDYLVHFDPTQTAELGLKAPLAQGLMSLTFMTEVLARDGVPDELDITAEFRRPIFWDDRIKVLARDERAFYCVGEDGVVRSTGRVAHLRRT